MPAKIYFNSKHIYQNGRWMMTQKEYDYENYLFEIPRNVIRTYLGTGVADEEFLSDFDYIVEISRVGFDQKQYEFHFSTPFTDKTGAASHLVNSIIISEDGSLLTFGITLSINNFTNKDNKKL